MTLPAALFTGNRQPTVQRQQITPPQQPVKVVPPRHNEAAPVAAVNQSSAVARSSAKPSAGNGFTIPADRDHRRHGRGTPVRSRWLGSPRR